MPPFVLRYFLLLLGTIGVVQPSDAQTLFQGVVVEDSSRSPIRRYPVALVRLLPFGESVAGRTKTDDRGLFQLRADKAGAYRLEFGDSLTLTYGPIDSVTVDTVILRQYAIRPLGDLSRKTLLEYHVEKPIVQLNGRILYPDALRQRGICGEVLASFVVDTLGRADMMTFTILHSTDSLFSRAVREGVSASQFQPAVMHGRAVSDRVQQPFVFTIVEGRSSVVSWSLTPLYTRDTLDLNSQPDVPHPSCWSRR